MNQIKNTDGRLIYTSPFRSEQLFFKHSAVVVCVRPRIYHVRSLKVPSKTLTWGSIGDLGVWGLDTRTSDRRRESSELHPIFWHPFAFASIRLDLFTPRKCRCDDGIAHNVVLRPSSQRADPYHGVLTPSRPRTLAIHGRSCAIERTLSHQPP